jgi:hypothetical protein
MKPDLTREEVAEILSYCPETGVFTWKVNRRGKAKAGTVAGSHGPHGYRRISIKDRPYLAHRLAFLLMTGAMPAGDVDHINGVRDDNRFPNLRDVTQAMNMQNQRRAQKGSETGLLGVSPHKGRFRATITVNGKNRKLGTFDSPQVAHRMYLAAKRLLHPGNLL